MVHAAFLMVRGLPRCNAERTMHRGAPCAPLTGLLSPDAAQAVAARGIVDLRRHSGLPMQPFHLDFDSFRSGRSMRSQWQALLPRRHGVAVLEERAPADGYTEEPCCL